MRGCGWLPASLLVLASVAAQAAGDAPGGAFTTTRADAEAYLQPAPVLSGEQLKRFKRGRKGFEIRWVVFPSLGGEWGLGPTFIAERCVDCHVAAGRGALPAPHERPVSLLVRVSVPGRDAHGGPRPHPAYGDQLQNRGLMGEDPRNHGYGERVQPEADLFVEWVEEPFELADGEVVSLRRPVLRIENLRYGALDAETMLSLRATPPVFGLGLLEAVPESTVLALAEAQQAAGLDGRPNRVHDMITGERALGRFGWKANVPSVRQQLAAAYIGDLGVTSSLFPEENCPPVQTDCAAQPPGNDPEIIDANLTDVEIWTLGLAVPARRNADTREVLRGEQLFADAGCAGCHVPELRTGPHPLIPELADQVIHPYTDLLLHDMGDGLADGRPDLDAGSRDWRTPPLWGLGLSETVNGNAQLLHDGRARNVTEAVLWHGGAAVPARAAFAAMPKEDRRALVAFVRSL